ncbi:PREDICTED: heavy metal-associated isoprenylated plant protein 9 [Nicotiana attenuata]|uniref:heavy metal-associated isoprenylated plant protein 9 n=1 Tax=Nicotiana attenuata TaxID=49451 RepID=UPI0009055FA3|nr:PREDICTED: heavy metal-associated isoprenylated plant protein 9 [Nicotiana attenuata]
MGEAIQQEPTKEEVKVEEKKEEQTEEKKEEKVEEEKKEEPKPPSPFVLYVDLHCVGCAKKIERSISKIRGVEGVVIDMAQNQVTIKGVIEPQAVCDRITKKTKRVAKVLSPLPEAEGEPIPEVVASQVSGLTTVELNVNMHCEACAEQLKKKILRMRGVRTAETEASTGKVTVTGTMDANKLVEYVYRRTKKQAKIVPQPEPEKPPEEPKPEESKPEEAKPAEEAKPDDGAAEKKDGDGEKPPEEEKKEGGEEQAGEDKKEGEEIIPIGDHDQMNINKMMYYYQPLYVIERIPPPQLFSDENPNACCIT